MSRLNMMMQMDPDLADLGQRRSLMQRQSPGQSPGQSLGQSDPNQQNVIGRDYTPKELDEIKEGGGFTPAKPKDRSRPHDPGVFLENPSVRFLDVEKEMNIPEWHRGTFTAQEWRNLEGQKFYVFRGQPYQSKEEAKQAIRAFAKEKGYGH